MIRTARAKAGPIAGLIHLVPLRIASDSGSMDAAVWRDRLNLDVRSLFLLARQLAADLTRARGAWLIAASALGGDFGAGASRTAVFPGHGAIAGLVKSLAKEWPDVRCRVVDCDGSEKADLIAGSLMEELSLDDSEI
jgi:NAD(P)-dependent dehydrogenase (short-subunit alcohol dehydrogenase family)